MKKEFSVDHSEQAFPAIPKFCRTSQRCFCVIRGVKVGYNSSNENLVDWATNFPAGNYMLKVNNRNTRTRCEICSKLTKKTPERRHWTPSFIGHWRRSGVFIVNFEYISHLASVSIVNFEQINAGWVATWPLEFRGVHP